MESAFWAAVLPDRSADFFPPLRTLLLVGGLLVGLMLLFADPLPRRTVGIAGLAGLAVILAGPAAHLLQTTTTEHSGAIISAGPTIAGGGFEPGGGQFLGGGQRLGGAPGGARGGLFGGGTPSAAVVTALSKDASAYSWVAAAIGSSRAADYQLATGYSVMPTGGFNGSDPSPTLAAFQKLVAARKIHYFIGGGIDGRQNGGSAATWETSTWITTNFAATAIGRVTVYDVMVAASAMATTPAATPTKG